MLLLIFYNSLPPFSSSSSPVTGGKHEWVPEDVKAEAEQYAKDTLKDSDDSEDDDD